ESAAYPYENFLYGWTEDPGPDSLLRYNGYRVSFQFNLSLQVLDLLLKSVSEELSSSFDNSAARDPSLCHDFSQDLSSKMESKNGRDTAQNYRYSDKWVVQCAFLAR